MELYKNEMRHSQLKNYMSHNCYLLGVNRFMTQTRVTRPPAVYRFGIPKRESILTTIEVMDTYRYVEDERYKIRYHVSDQFT